MRSVRCWSVLLLLVALAALPACTITWREPTIQPLNTSRFYAAELNPTCDAAQQAAATLGVPIQEVQQQERACLISTDFKVLPDTGENPLDHLKEVAWVGVGGFIGGRYSLTITARTVRDGGTRVRITTRIEGYVNEEFGYQVLRSKGLIESHLFDAIGQRLGTPPVEAS